MDTDGHILLSSRNTSEVTKINADTGEIIWRLGGTHNQFTYVNDPLNGPRNQHAIRPLGNNRYTLFDNGNGHSPQVSRAVEYELNPTTMTATRRLAIPGNPDHQPVRLLHGQSPSACPTATPSSTGRSGTCPSSPRSAPMAPRRSR